LVKVNLYQNSNSPRNQFEVQPGVTYEGREVWFNGDKIYLFQKMGIWFISTNVGALSGFAYSRDGGVCPTEYGYDIAYKIIFNTNIF